MRWKYSHIHIFILLGFFMNGCATFSKSKTGSNAGGIEGKILNGASLQRGGAVLIVPFTAGEGVAQTDELQKISFRLVRGLSETLQSATQLSILSGDTDPSQAVFVIKGRIVRLKEEKGFPKFIGARSIRRDLMVQGELVDRSKGETIVYFSDNARGTRSQEDFNVLAERIGQKIGAFIVAGMK